MTESGTSTSSLPDASKLRHLKEGDIYINKDGKKYRVRKTVLPQSAAAGPHGEGDPNDHSMRRLEADVLIPNLMNKEIERVACRDVYVEMIKCLREWGDVKGLWKCQDALAVFNKCKKEKFDDHQFRQLITDRYLEQRAELRRTGKPPNEQRLDAYREWKSKQNVEEAK